jgi:hypothetical protein
MRLATSRLVGSLILLCALGLALLALAGCGPIGAGGTVKPQLPALPPSAVASCGRPTAKVGDDLGVLAARFNAARACEAGKRAAIIGYYNGLKTGLAGK